jgi:hypothetical protein
VNGPGGSSAASRLSVHSTLALSIAAPNRYLPSTLARSVLFAARSASTSTVKRGGSNSATWITLSSSCFSGSAASATAMRWRPTRASAGITYSPATLPMSSVTSARSASVSSVGPSTRTCTGVAASGKICSPSLRRTLALMNTFEPGR